MGERKRNAGRFRHLVVMAHRCANYRISRTMGELYSYLNDFIGCIGLKPDTPPNY